MRAMQLRAPRTALEEAQVAEPEPGPGQVLIKVSVCGLCRTDLHVVDGEIATPRLPLIPGHQVVGEVVSQGPGAERYRVGDRVGVPWLGWTCGACEYCRAGAENLCPPARFTGLDLDGGYAEYTVADERFCFAIPAGYPDLEAAPLLCAGMIGYRALRLAGDGVRLGLYGFGAAARIIAQVARYQGRRVFAFVEADDAAAAAFARSLQAEWAGDALLPGSEPLDAANIFAPAGELVPAARRAMRPGGRWSAPGST
jgi:alcohol dehydrogenase, propanol-preferring